MHILDTNHISILERRNADSERLMKRLAELPLDSVKVTVISYEEQIRGWTAAISRAKESSLQVPLYERLQGQLENYCRLALLPYSVGAADRFNALRKMHRRTSTPDLKIAAITLENQAVLLTQNLRDFQNIEGLNIEDWTR